MAEEFEESEVIFPDRDEFSIKDYYFTREEYLNNDEKANKRRISNSRKIKNNNKTSERWGTTGSLPVDIPISNVLRLGHDEYQDWLEEEYDGGELVPPHVIVGRRIAGKMAFSVCTGNGRTLKGRDLREVRNSILRLTGFLET